MKSMKSILLGMFILLFGSNIQAGPGDTIMIQTFEFEGYPVGEGWLAPRDGSFDFSEVDGLEFAKVFMHYTLKCDPSQSPACGEWDYLSYIKLMEHTGIGYHPSYSIGGEGGLTPAEFSYMEDVSWKYASRFEDDIIYDNPNEYIDYEVGTGDINLSNPFGASLSDSRNFYLYKADELLAAGLTVGQISGMQFDIISAGDMMKRLNIRMKQTTEDELSESVDTEGFTTVFSKDMDWDNVGWQNIEFTNVFDWDGFSNIIVDIYFDGEAGTEDTQVKGDTYGWNCASSSNDPDYFLNFNGPDAIPLPVDNFSELDSVLSISFWLKGNEEQPQNDMLFLGSDVDNKRIINVHLPWSNGRIYWDVGNSTYYDRIDKAADNPQQYKGEWNHWTFTKKLEVAKMSIFLNGEEWHTSSGKFAVIGVIDSLVLGANIGSGDRFYDGQIDDFCIWGAALEQETIAEWMDKDIDATHPNYEELLAYYKFDEEDGYYTSDEVTGESISMQGVPQRMNYRGERMKKFSTSTERPNIKFMRHTSSFTINTEMVIDSFPLGEIILETYIQENAGEQPILDELLYVYPTYYNNYTYDENGIATDSTLVAADVNLVLEMIEYNTSEPGVEILIPWEVGRFITPYGNNLSLGNDGWTWVYDVTDFQHLFQGDNVHFRAGNFQELLDMKMYFVEGTPPRQVLDIKSLYSANPQLSNFDEVIVDTLVELHPDAEMFSLKTTLSGHWFGDGNNCAEFCPNIHSVDVNGNEEYSWQIIQECGDNSLYPQGGTWFYDRAGWCPGMPVTEKNLDLTPFIDVGIDHYVEVDYDVEYDPYGNYVTEIYFVSYDEPNFINDASIEEIIAPNDFKLNGRYNPICGNPIIRIKNTGTNHLSSLVIEYGVEDGQVYTYNWTGNLAFLDEEVVQLPTVDADDFYDSGSSRFVVNISQPNGTTDEYEENNMNASSFDLAPAHNEQIVVWFKTNNLPWENHYEIKDTDGNILFIREDMEANTVYADTLNLMPGCYEFMAYDTEGDGMYNWPSNAGNGYVIIKDLEGNTIETLENWFGEYLRYKFLNTAYPVAIEDNNLQTFNIWPNPSDGNFSLELIGNHGIYEIEVTNPAGQIVYKTNIECNNPGVYNLDLSILPSGFYVVSIASNKINHRENIVINK